VHDISYRIDIAIRRWQISRYIGVPFTSLSTYSDVTVTHVIKPRTARRPDFKDRPALTMKQRHSYPTLFCLQRARHSLSQLRVVYTLRVCVLGVNDLTRTYKQKTWFVYFNLLRLLYALFNIQWTEQVWQYQHQAIVLKQRRRFIGMYCERLM
jgi:hypothetical protein